VVDSFKLLGITIDNKLNFAEHCSNIKKMINRKIYSIKRLFYLATAVKKQFFKTFILPYFDYCSSLLTYYPKFSIQSLNNCFNLFLSKLFKIKPDKVELNLDSLIDDISAEQDNVMNNLTEHLQRYGLFTIQKRLFDRLLFFTHSILNYSNSPHELKETIFYRIKVLEIPLKTFLTLEIKLKQKISCLKRNMTILLSGIFFPKANL
jgi:hypothetical protein